MTANSNSSSNSDDTLVPVSDDYGIRIDGDALVLPSGCTMPSKCVKTNQPVSESDMIFANLGWAPKSVGLWALLGTPFLIVAHFANRELCTITYGLNRRQRIKNVVYTIAKILSSAGLLAATIGLSIIPSNDRFITPLIWITFILFLASIVIIFIGNSPLRVVEYRDGLFWVKGFSQEFLDDLEL